MDKPSYYSIIPANVRYDTKLTPNSKLLYAEITSLCNMNGKCTASTNYFCVLYGVTKTSVQKWLKSLEDNGYIARKVKYKKGSKQIETRYITIITYPTQQKDTTPSKQMLLDNTNLTDSINTNTTYSNNKLPDYVSKEFEEVFSEWLSYKKERNESYKTIGMKACYNNLVKLSNNNSDIAKQIIENSMANGYKGFFELKQSNRKPNTSKWENMEDGVSL